MGNPFSIPCDPCVNKVFQWVDEKGGYTQNLEKNLVDLEITMETLKAKRDDLSRRVTRAEDRGLQRLAEIQVWLTSVETIENRVDDVLSKRNVQLQKLCLCGFCSKSLTSSYRYGKRVFLTLKEVEKLKNEEFQEVADQPQTSVVHERPLQRIIVGQEKKLDKAWKHLKDDKVGMMGMYGMGGVGKTTLLTHLNNKFSGERLGFDFVIWVVVSKELNVEKIQNEIAEKIGLGGEEWKKKDKIQKTDVIYNFLRKKKFVLFLDDIWDKVDLAEIGVPFPTPENQCKVAFATRSLGVCTSMEVEDPMEIKCLDDDEAFDLFQKKVGKKPLQSDPEIPKLARIISDKCAGLPLALNVIGETMSCKRTVQEWHDAIHVLNSYATQFKGMKDNILPLLKYSYDNLKEEQLQSCFLYCALFPEDDEIPKDRLIDFWICEGIIDKSDGVETAENKGYVIINSLVRASLLMEKVKWDGLNDIVCMHDVVHEMALWIASDLGKQQEAFIVHAGVGLKQKPKVNNWNVVRRMSLMKNKTTNGYVHNLDYKPECPELTTLLLQYSDLQRISSEFFKSMPKLAVLDLSENEDLSESLDGISELGSLQFLDLSDTAIHHLPKGLHRLQKLIHLNLDRTPNLSSIVGISSLQNLKVLKLVECGFPWDRETLEELGKLQHLEILNTSFDRYSHLEQFFRSQKLTSCMRYLQIHRTESESSFGVSLPGTMNKLCYFNIWDSRDISEIKMERINIKSFSCLSSVSIENCKRLKELTFLMFAENLKRLDIECAYDLEDIIKKEKASEGSGIIPFKKLSFLRFYYLPKLKSIYWEPLPFPYLKKFYVGRCPNLKKLPLNSESCKHGEDGLIINYTTEEWVEGLEWEDEATKTRFLPSCQEEFYG